MTVTETTADKLFRWNGRRYVEEAAVFCPGCRVRLEYVICDLERLSLMSRTVMPGICPECDARLFLLKLEGAA
jgi:hypothetical protein